MDADVAGRRMLSAAAITLVLISGPVAADVTVRPAIVVSPGPSPFRGCIADDVPGQQDQYDATNYPNTEIEPWLAVNPRDRRNLIAGWQQDRWSDGGARGNYSAYSTDGGTSWTKVRLPRTTKCTGGPWTRATDPWIDIAPNGTAYFMSLVFENAPPTGGDGPNAMVVTRSLDGGRTWSGPITLREDRDPRFFNDKNALTADPTDARYAYAVWDRLENLELGGPGRPQRPPLRELAERSHSILNALRWPASQGALPITLRELAASPAAREGAAPEALPPLFKGPAWVARTVDGGRSWEPAHQIYDPGVNRQTIGNQVAVLPNGDVLNFFTEIRLPDETAYRTVLRYQRSTDKGATFLPTRDPPPISRREHDGQCADHRRLHPGPTVRGARRIAPVRCRGRSAQRQPLSRLAGQAVPVVHLRGLQPRRQGGLLDVARWRPHLVAADPRQPDAAQRQSFPRAGVPAVGRAVDGDGTIVVTYYDFRNDVPGLRELSDHWGVFCRPAAADCALASSWGEEVRLTDRSFDYYLAPVARGLFLGDYMGLAGAGRLVHALYGVADGVDRTSLFTRRIEAGATATGRQ